MVGYAAGASRRQGGIERESAMEFDLVLVYLG